MFPLRVLAHGQALRIVSSLITRPAPVVGQESPTSTGVDHQRVSNGRCGRPGPVTVRFFSKAVVVGGDRALLPRFLPPGDRRRRRT